MKNLLIDLFLWISCLDMSFLHLINTFIPMDMLDRFIVKDGFLQAALSVITSNHLHNRSHHLLLFTFLEFLHVLFLLRFFYVADDWDVLLLRFSGFDNLLNFFS
jgi:hypothetical protein